MRFQNVGDRRVLDRVTDVGHFGLDSIKTPVRILFSKLHSEVDDDLPHPWLLRLLLFATNFRFQRRMVSDVNREPTCSSCLRPGKLPLTAKRRRWSSVSTIRFLPSFAWRTVFSVRRCSMTSCCCRLPRLARMISINRHGCGMNFIGVPVVRKTREAHWCETKCKPGWASVKAIGACLRSG